MGHSAVILAAVGAVATLALGGHLEAQVASSLLNEGDTIAGTPIGHAVFSIGPVVVNDAGGFALRVDTAAGTDTLSHIWGNAAGGPGALRRTEDTLAGLEQYSFEDFHGLSDAGLSGYSAMCTDVSSGASSLDTVWVGDTPVAVEGRPVASLTGMDWTFASRCSMTADGTPWWVSGVAPAGTGGSTQNRGLFRGLGAEVVLMGGQNIPGVAEPLETAAAAISFNFRVSALGSHYVAEVNLQGDAAQDNLMVLDGAAMSLGGNLVREGTAVPAAVGGLVGESWANFDYCAVNEAGRYLLTGDTTAAAAVDEFICLDGSIVLREGDTLGPYTLTGSISSAHMNESGDWAAVWDVEDGAGGSLEALIFNGQVLLVEGDAVDFDGDGNVDPGATLADFSNIDVQVAVGARSGLTADLYFTADVTMGGLPVEGLYKMTAPIPEPASAAIMGLGLGALAARRRRRRRRA
jgi:hypothetical protein